MPSIKNNLKMNYNELQQAVIQIASADPNTGNEVMGQIYYNSTSKQLRQYDGAAWQSASGGATTLNDLTDVDTTGVADGSYMYYDNGTGTYKVRALDASVVVYAGDLSGATVEAALNGVDTRLDTLEAASHDAVTIGTGNGLSLSTQELSLALATTGSAGAMSGADKTKLDAITGTNTGDQNLYSAVSDGSNTATANSTTTQLNIVSGDNISVVVTPGTHTVTISVPTSNTIDADTVDGSHAADLLARANHTGTQLASTISDFTAAARATLSIAAGSTAYMSYNNSTGEFSVSQLLITDVTTSAAASLAAYVATVPTHENGDVVILTTPGESYIVSGADGSVVGNYTLLEAPTDTAAIRALFSGGNGIDYIAATGVFSADVASDGAIINTGGTGDQLEVVVDAATIQINGSNQLEVIESGLTLDNIGGTLSISKGGTGQTTAVAAFDALAPTTTKGDVIVHNGTNNIRLAVGADGTVLTADSGEASGLTWAVPLKKYAQDAVLGAVAGTVTITHNLNTTDVQVQLYDSSGELTFVDVDNRTANTVDVAATGANETYRVVVIG